MSDLLQLNGKTYLPLGAAGDLVRMTEAQIRAAATAGRVRLQAVGKKIYVERESLLAFSAASGSQAAVQPMTQGVDARPAIAPFPKPLREESAFVPAPRIVPQQTVAPTPTPTPTLASSPTPVPVATTNELPGMMVMPHRQEDMQRAPVAAPVIPASTPKEIPQPIPVMAPKIEKVRPVQAPIVPPVSVTPRDVKMDTVQLDGKTYLSMGAAIASIGMTEAQIRQAATAGRVLLRAVGKKVYVERESLQSLKSVARQAQPIAVPIPAPQRASVKPIAPVAPAQQAVVPPTLSPITPAAVAAMPPATPRATPSPITRETLEARSKSFDTPLARRISSFAINVAVLLVFVSGIAGVAALSDSPVVGKAATAISERINTLRGTQSAAVAGTQANTATIENALSPSQVQYTLNTATLATSSDSIEAMQPIYYVYNYPVIERVIEQAPKISATSAADFTVQLQDMYNKIQVQISQLGVNTGNQLAQTYQVVAQTNRIDQLSGVDISGGTISGAAISGGSITGVSLSAGDLTGVIGIANGGTGTSSAPVYGQLLLGDGAGGYTLAATSSIGLAPTDLLSSANTWTALQVFAANASSSNFSNVGTAYFGGTATTTIDSAGNLVLAGLTSSGLGVNASGQVYAAATTTFSSGLVYAGGNTTLNTANANTWTALQIFSANASSTNFSNFGTAYFGGTATTTIDSAGNLIVAGNTTLANATTTSIFSTTASSTNLFSTNATIYGLAQFSLASTSQLSVYQKSYFGATATSTFDSAGNLYVVGNVGIGTTSPFRKLSVTDTVSAAQLAVAYDTTRYSTFQTDASGDLVIDPSGNDAFLNDDNLWVCTGGSCPSGTPSGTGNLIVENKLGVGTSTPYGALSISQSSDSVTGGLVSRNSAGTQSTYLYSGSDNASYFQNDGGYIALTSGGDVGVGTTSPSAQFATVGLIFVGGNGATTLGTATSTFYGDIKIAGKLDVGTIDPVYTIDGTKFATYGHSTIGIKEEVVAKVVPTIYDQKRKLYEYQIDFSELEEGSDMWLFSKVTDFGKDWSNLVVSLTPGFDGNVFYEQDIEHNILHIYANKSAPVSVRLIASRFDFSKWANLRPDQDGDTLGTHIIDTKKGR